jgi:hypothetical protein
MPGMSMVESLGLSGERERENGKEKEGEKGKRGNEIVLYPLCQAFLKVKRRWMGCRNESSF